MRGEEREKNEENVEKVGRERKMRKSRGMEEKFRKGKKKLALMTAEGANLG